MEREGGSVRTDSYNPSSYILTWTFMPQRATFCNTLQHSATHCSARTGSYLVMCCNALQRPAAQDVVEHAVQHAARNCKTLKYVATHCNTLQHTATHCKTLQHEHWRLPGHVLTLWVVLCWNGRWWLVMTIWMACSQKKRPWLSLHVRSVHSHTLVVRIVQMYA